MLSTPLLTSHHKQLNIILVKIDINKKDGGFAPIVKDANGYLMHKGKYIHRLVWESVCGAIPKKMVVHHINKNIEDNRLKNLVMLTRKEHVISHIGYETIPNKNSFNDYWFSDKEKQEVLEIRAEQKKKKRQESKEKNQYSKQQVKKNLEQLKLTDPNWQQRLDNLQLFRNTHEGDYHILLKYGIIRSESRK